MVCGFFRYYGYVMSEQITEIENDEEVPAFLAGMGMAEDCAKNHE